MAEIAVMGHGVVGSGVMEVLISHKDSIAKRAKEEVHVKHILDLREFPGLPYSGIFTKDFNRIVNDPQVKIVVEVMGGLEPAYTYVKACLEHGKSVVTSNKELVAQKGAELLALARLAMENSYCPYSHYAVGAALLSADGRVFQGCNIENASFGLTNCAERTALFKAVSEGARDFTAIAIASNGSAPYPCGACRQALNEFAPGLRVLVTWGEGEVDETTLSALLPHGFGPKDLPG